MKAHVSTKIIIAAKPERVFEFLQDTRHHASWNPHLVSIKPLVKLETGAVYRSYSEILGVKVSGKNTVEACTPPTKLMIENSTGPLMYCVTYNLRAIKEGTLLSCKTVVSAEGKAFAFARPLLSELARRELHTDLAALKAVVEQPSA